VGKVFGLSTENRAISARRTINNPQTDRNRAMWLERPPERRHARVITTPNLRGLEPAAGRKVRQCGDA